MRNIIFRQVEMTFLRSHSWKITRVETRTLFQEEAKPRALPPSLGAPSTNQAKGTPKTVSALMCSDSVIY